MIAATTVTPDYYQILKAQGNKEEAFANMVAHRAQCRDAWLGAAAGWYQVAQADDCEQRMTAYAHATECEARAAEYEL